MGWFLKKGDQDFGEYLPDDEAELKEEVIHIEAKNKPQAQEKCEEEAKVYDGFGAEVESKGEKQFDCRFKFWG